MDRDSEGERQLAIAIDAHCRGDSHAVEWYLRAIGELLVELKQIHAASKGDETP